MAPELQVHEASEEVLHPTAQSLPGVIVVHIAWVIGEATPEQGFCEPRVISHNNEQVPSPPEHVLPRVVQDLVVLRLHLFAFAPHWTVPEHPAKICITNRLLKNVDIKNKRTKNIVKRLLAQNFILPL